MKSETLLDAFRARGEAMRAAREAERTAAVNTHSRALTLDEAAQAPAPHGWDAARRYAAGEVLERVPSGGVANYRWLDRDGLVLP